MRSIAVLNQKGGVGKTTTAVNVAAALARAEQRVLLIDLDPQAHASQHLGIELAEGETSIYDVLAGDAALAETARSAAHGLAVVPSHIDLVAAEVELAQRARRESILARALEPYGEHFDFVIIDCPPSLGILTVNALAAATEVLIPLQPHFFALQGLGKLLETVTRVREHVNAALRVSGIPLCMYEQGTRLAQEVTRDVIEFVAAADPRDAWHGARVFETRIRRNIKLAEAPSFGQSIFEYDAASHGAEDYAALVREILAMDADRQSSEKIIAAGTAAAEPLVAPGEAPPCVNPALDGERPATAEVSPTPAAPS